MVNGKPVTQMLRLSGDNAVVSLKTVVAIVVVLAGFAATWYQQLSTVRLMAERITVLSGKVADLEAQAGDDHDDLVLWKQKAEDAIRRGDAAHALCGEHRADLRIHRNRRAQ